MIFWGRTIIAGERSLKIPYGTKAVIKVAQTVPYSKYVDNSVLFPTLQWQFTYLKIQVCEYFVQVLRE